MTANELAKLYKMQPHEENGTYVERHYVDDSDKRPHSGSIYYFLGSKEKAQFHILDCDEYWAYVAGSDLELWLIKDGKLTQKTLGTGDGKEPLIYIPQGTIFGAKHFGNPTDGTFLSCITVPRFEYKGWRLVEQKELEQLCPQAKSFFE